MYMMFRNMQASAGHMPDAMALAVAARDHLNGQYGGHYGVSINIGGDPSAISLASPFATLGAYEAMRASIAGDAEMQSMVSKAAGLVSNVRDSIGQVIKAPGGRGAYAQVSVAMMHMPAVVDAIGFAVEVAEFVDNKLGRGVGVIAAMTGNRAGLMWLSYADSLDQVGTESQALETDPDYLAFFKRSDQLFTPGTLEQSIWQILP